MAGASDKARFYLEQSIPELQDDLKKQIFTRDEITAITKKRSDFEHVLNARGSSPADYVRYAEYEMALNTLRNKRVKRFGVKSSNYAGARRIFFILDRGTRKFHGDLGLWKRYLDFARTQKSYKKLEKILTSVLRMHPTKSELWIYAASYALDLQADIGGARGYMQRGLRFCPKSRDIWVEYAKLEMMYIGKIEGRRKILGLDVDRSQEAQDALDEDENADEMALPTITGEDVNPALPQDDSIDKLALQNLASTPVMTGAIPKAIFDAAMKEFRFNSNAPVAEAFFSMLTTFAHLSCTKSILQHIIAYLEANAANSIELMRCRIQLPLVGVDPPSAELLVALQETLRETKRALSLSQHDDWARKILAHALSLLAKLLTVPELDSAVRQFITGSLRLYMRKHGDAAALVELIEDLVRQKRVAEAKVLSQLSKSVYEGSAEIEAFAS